MKDPHVESLIYKLQTAQNVTYDNPSPLEIDYEEFSGRLENGVLTCQMKVHYPSIEAARRVVDPYLRAWEIDAALSLGRGEIRFIYEDGKVVDRNPPLPGEPQVLKISSTGHLHFSGTATIHVTRKQYPKPPKTFKVSPDVQTLWHRYEMYLDGKEPLLSMAYFCLTVIEAKAGGRLRASAMFAIEEEVWGKMTLVDTKVELKYKRRRCQNGKDSKSDLHERASRGSGEAGSRRGIKDTGGRA